MTILKKIPFTYLWIVKHAVGKEINTVLDLGCGDGEFMEKLQKGEKWQITGVELHSDSIIAAKKRNIYKRVIRGNIVNLPMAVNKNKYDAVICSQVLEHITKKDGKKALQTWETLANKKLVVSTPTGFIEYAPIETKNENNPLQKHLSGWQPEEMQKMGFSVYGQGARLIYGENGIARVHPNLFTLFSVLGLFLAPIVYFFPKLATYMIAAKDV
jgi:ubiquinone/menaquinone biosynthesis C-methylase UbiE